MTIVREHGSDYEAKMVADWSEDFEDWERDGSPASGETGNVSRFINLKDCLA